MIENHCSAVNHLLIFITKTVGSADNFNTATEGNMNILIVESDPDLGAIWSRHLIRQGHDVTLAQDQQEATDALDEDAFDVIVLDVILARGSSLTVADLVATRQPDIGIVFVTSSSFFSDGSIFNLNPNARAFLQSDTPPEDLTAVIEHYGRVV